jgi:hypothetical protein
MNKISKFQPRQTKQFCCARIPDNGANGIETYKICIRRSVQQQEYSSRA